MKRLFRLSIASCCLFLVVPLVHAAATVGQPAPDFSLPGSDGKTYALADARGKFVVLEWYNLQCPFIRKHYDSGNMQKLQQTYTQKGVIWYEILSSAPGKEGYLTASEAQKNRDQEKTLATATLLDPSGKVGQLYGARTTPNMFVIDPSGKLIYEGAIDDHASTNASDIPQSKNYVAQALDEALAGKPVSIPYTKPYGCSVKYKK